MSDYIDYAGLDKADVLAALYNNARPLGMGWLHYDPAPMTRAEAAKILETQDSFDYLKGRVMKVDLYSCRVDIGCYDRDNGHGAAQRVIDELRAAK